MAVATYNPSLHTVTNKSLGIAQGVPTDARSYAYDPDLFLYRKFITTAEVLQYLNTPTSRTGEFSIFVKEGGTLDVETGIITGGETVEYWFKDGVADENLVVKGSSGEGVPGPQGPAGVGTYELAVLNGFSGDEAEFLDSLIGPQGPQGDQGPVGPQGPQGIPGDGGGALVFESDYFDA